MNRIEFHVITKPNKIQNRYRHDYYEMYDSFWSYSNM